MRVSWQFYFLTERISDTRKAQKAQSANKRLSLRRFLLAQKAQKAQNVKQTTFFFLDVFMRIKMLSFLFHTQKSTKSTKST